MNLTLLIVLGVLSFVLIIVAFILKSKSCSKTCTTAKSFSITSTVVFIIGLILFIAALIYGFIGRKPMMLLVKKN